MQWGTFRRVWPSFTAEENREEQVARNLPRLVAEAGDRTCVFTLLAKWAQLVRSLCENALSAD